MNLIKGTTKTYNGIDYSANVAFNSKFVDYFKENADSEAELLLVPDGENDTLSSNASIFVMNEPHFVLKRLAGEKTKEFLDITVEKVDFEPVTNYALSIPADKVIYISNRPLFSSALKKSGDTSDVGGGMGSGTFILATTAKMGVVLYWTSEDYADVLDTLVGTTIIYVATGTARIDALPNSFYVVTTAATGGQRDFKLPDTSDYKGSSITVVKLAGVISLSVIPSGTDTINGGAGQDLSAPYDRITVFSTGFEWIITGIYID